MARHDHAGSGLNDRAPMPQAAFPQFGVAQGHVWRGAVRILHVVGQTGKVFGAGDNSRILQAPHRRAAQERVPRHVSAETADRVVRVFRTREDVYRRREVHVNTARAHLDAQRVIGGVGVRFPPRCAQRHIARRRRRAEHVVNRRGHAALPVQRDKQRDAPAAVHRDALNLVNERRALLRKREVFRNLQEESANALFRNQGAHFGRERDARITNEMHLHRFLLERQPGQNGFDFSLLRRDIPRRSAQEEDADQAQRQVWPPSIARSPESRGPAYRECRQW